MYGNRQTFGPKSAFCKGLLIFFEKSNLGFAPFKNSCIFASAFENKNGPFV